MACPQPKPRRETKSKLRRGRRPERLVFADLDRGTRSRITQRASRPWLSAREIYEYFALEARGIGERAFRRKIAEIRLRLGVKGGLRGPRTLNHRAELYATSLLEHLGTNHSDEFVSAVVEELSALHFGSDERRPEPGTQTPKKQRIDQ